MGILFGFLLVCMILYAILVSHAAYFILKLFLINLMSIPISQKLIWVMVNVLIWALATRFIYFLMIDSRRGTPNIEVVWKFYLILNTILFLIVFLFGYKSK